MHPSVQGVILTYHDLLDIVKAVSDARVHGGIHFRTDQDAAEHKGRSVAQWNGFVVLDQSVLEEVAAG